MVRRDGAGHRRLRAATVVVQEGVVLHRDGPRKRHDRHALTAGNRVVVDLDAGGLGVVDSNALPARDVGDDVVANDDAVRCAPVLHDGDGGVVDAETVVNLVALDEVILIRAVHRYALRDDAPRVVVVSIAGDVVLTDRDVGKPGFHVNTVALRGPRAAVEQHVALDRDVVVRWDTMARAIIGAEREPIGIYRAAQASRTADIDQFVEAV